MCTFVSGTQKVVSRSDTETQTDSPIRVATPPQAAWFDEDVLTSSPQDHEQSDDADEDYVMSSSGSSISDADLTPPRINLSADSDMFLVSWSSLVLLLRLMTCAKCAEGRLVLSQTTRGTFLQVLATCFVCGHEMKWNSQSYTGSVPSGNLLLSAAILTSGAIASQVLRLLQHMKVATITVRTFFIHQRQFLLPAIRNVWTERQTWLVAALQADQRDLVLAGDGRCDSPGHSAKYGSYTMLEVQRNVIIDMQLVQVFIK